jgi:predicted TIM-barrel fold metal-dependent hydrolase
VKEIVMTLPGLGKPFGDPIYDPIHKAAADMDLTIGLHTGGEQFLAGAAHIQAGGVPNTRFERHNQLAQSTHHHLMSYIVHGTFEKFRNLRIIAKEVGLALYPNLIWEMDGVYELLKQETTNVRRWPREYFYDHVWVATQPIEHSPKVSQLINLLETLEGFEDRLVFATDYPHHDTDDPHYVDRRIPQKWWTKVFLENPAAAYNWSVEELAAVGSRYQEVKVGAA